MSERYEPGQTVRLFWSITNPDDGAPVVGAAATVTVTGPDGSTQSPTVAEGPPGTYVATVVAARPIGYWSYVWIATGAAVTARSGRFYVVEHSQPRAA